MNDVIGEWEMSGLDMSGEGAFASPTPGAAMHRFTSTIKHKGTGKECKDGVDIVEWFFDKDGKCSGGKFFWGNPKGVAATYPPMPAPPPAVTAFFDGKPMAGKVEALPTLMDEALVVEFIGPYAGATTGLKLDKPKMLGTAPTRTLTLTLAPAPTPTPNSDPSPNPNPNTNPNPNPDRQPNPNPDQARRRSSSPPFPTSPSTRRPCRPSRASTAAGGPRCTSPAPSTVSRSRRCEP